MHWTLCAASVCQHAHESQFTLQVSMRKLAHCRATVCVCTSECAVAHCTAGCAVAQRATDACGHGALTLLLDAFKFLHHHAPLQ
jgi:hypothetical protein